MKRNSRFLGAAPATAALLAVWPVCTFAQDAKGGAGDSAKAALQAKVAELKQSLAANQKALQQYTWVETTEISLKGEVKKTERKECRYGADGKVMKTDLPDATQPASSQPSGGGRRGGRGGGAMKEKIVANKVDDLKTYMGEVGALVKQYVPPDPNKLQAAMQGGRAALKPESAPNITELAFTDYVVPGDRLAISLNTATKQLAAVNVDSYLGKEKDTVTLAVRFASLAGAVNYAAETVLAAKAKQVQVKITNSGYKK